MIFVFIPVALISYFNLKWVYQNCNKTQAVFITLLFAGTLAVCMMTAAGVQLQSMAAMVGDLMKRMGLAYPPME